MSRGRLRRLFRDIHLWIGVGLAVLLIPLGLSGSALVYRTEIAALLAQRTGAIEAARLGPSAYLAAARVASEGIAPAQLRYPAGRRGPVQVILRGGRRGEPGWRPGFLIASLDPATAKVLKIANPRDGVFGVTHALHESLMIPGFGCKLVGWLGVAMTLSCFSGLYLWWPRGAVVKGFAWRRTPSGFSNLHHFAGFWVLVPLTALSLTGIYISFPQTARTATALVAPVSPPGARFGPRRGGAISDPNLDADTALAAAEAAAPGLVLRSISLPTRGPAGTLPAWRVSFAGPGGAGTSILVDDATGAARLAPMPPRQAGDGIALAIRRLHEGAGLGGIWRALVFVTGLAPALLAITGVVIWLRRRARRRGVQATAVR